MLRISLAERAAMAPAMPGRRAAVALPRIAHPQYGDCLVASGDQRSHHTGACLDTWVTERGVHVECFPVDLPLDFVAAAVADEREVAEIAYLRVADLLAAPVRPEFHRVHPRDHGLDEDEVWFESPTIRVAHPADGRTWTLWGLAGHMVARWREAVLGQASN